MDIEKIAKGLRCCAVDFNSTQSRLCNECQYGIYADGKKACENKLKYDAADAIEALQAKLPKEGEWMKNIRWDYQQPTQTVATNVGTTFMCRSTGKLCQNATEYGYCKQTACTIDLV